MIEIAVGGAVPRFELPEWRRDFGIVAGITASGNPDDLYDMGLAGAAPVGRVLDRWTALAATVPGFTGTVVARQVHGTMVLWHSEVRGLVIYEGADGHATSTPGVLLAVTAADCVPVYLIDPVRRFVALVHAGWRGASGEILSAALHVMKLRGSIVENVLVHCGIGICAACYEVGSEVFQACGIRAPKAGKGPFDIRGILAAQARGLGVESVSTSPHCTRHDPGFFSHRGSGGQGHRMAAYIGIIP